MIPVMPWDKLDDGDRLGWRLAWRLWKRHWLPYRTAELLGWDEETLEMHLGPWKWRRPGWMERR